MTKGNQMSKHMKLHVIRDSDGKYCVSLGGHPLYTTRIAGAKPVGSTTDIFTFYVDVPALKMALKEFESDGEALVQDAPASPESKK